jgi:hypothetical protein
MIGVLSNGKYAYVAFITGKQARFCAKPLELADTATKRRHSSKEAAKQRHNSDSPPMPTN